jgi:hypothetical protein
MNLKQGSKANLLLQLSILYGLIVGDVTKWQFGQPLALVNDAGGSNTQIRLTPTTDNPDYGDSRIFKYDRTPLTEVQRNFPAHISHALTGADSTHDCFAYLLRYTGILLDETDVEDLPLTDNGDGTYVIALQAKAGSLFWTGTGSVQSGDTPNVNQAITSSSFDWS